jgi:hypothetical protein
MKTGVIKGIKFSLVNEAVKQYKQLMWYRLVLKANNGGRVPLGRFIDGSSKKK